MGIEAKDIPLPVVSATSTLAEYRETLRQELADGEMTCCAACGQTAKVYARPINGTMVKALAELAKAPNGLTNQQILAATRQGGGGNVSLLVHWSMVESWPGSVWRITKAGRLFLADHWEAAHKVILYNNRFLGLDTSRLVKASDLADVAFDRAELLAASAVATADVGFHAGGNHAA